MSEQELKLHVPKEAQAAVEQAVRRGRAQHIQLRALYFDTPSRELVRARIALRLRLEGQQWVQTLKMPGENSLSRIEINQDRPDSTLDLSVYEGTAAGEVFKQLKQPLEICYETDVQRLFRQTRTASGTVEIAFDRGWIKAGALQLPISEVEFELIRGPLTAIFELGRRWQKKFGLILDFRSKAERGDRLAQLAQTLKTLDTREALDEDATKQKTLAQRQQVAQFWSPRTAQTVSIKTSSHAHGIAHVLADVTAECLEQIVRNAAFLCEVDTAGVYQCANSEHVHQLRVGIRRLRSAWSFFDGLAPLPSPEHREAITFFFSQLGLTRDDDVLREFLLPALEKAGQPPLNFPSFVTQNSGVAVAKSHAFQDWLLDMLESVVTTPTSPAVLSPDTQIRVNEQDVGSGDFPFPRTLQERPLKPLLLKKLKKWHRQILKEGLTFGTLALERQHVLRKKCKRLRYALQFCESLLNTADLTAYRKQLSTTQDILGEMNDLFVAESLFVDLRDTQPQAWFASGWIVARRESLQQEAARSFGVLAETQPPWS